MRAKQQMIVQALSGHMVGREFEDAADDMVMSMSEIKANLTGDDRAIRMVELTHRVRQLENEKSGFEAEQGNRVAARARGQRELAALEQRDIPSRQAWADRLSTAFAGDGLTLNLDGIEIADRKEIVKAIDGAFSELEQQASRKSSDRHAVAEGTINGIKMRLHVGLHASFINAGSTKVEKRVHLYDDSGVTRMLDSEVANGTGALIAIAAAARNAPASVTKLEKQAQQHREHLAELERAVTETWGKDSELEGMRTELSGLQAAMMAEPAKARTRKGGPGSGDAKATTAASPVPVSMDPAAKPVSAHAIVARMEQEFGIPFRTGRLKGRAAGVYKVRPEVVRIKGRYAGDLGIASHELAHHIDKTTDVLAKLTAAERAELKALDYDPTQQRADEGFAEFIRLALTEDGAAQTAAPAFSARFDKWLEGQPELAGKLASVRDLITQWREQGAGARIKANISKTGKAERPEGVSLPGWLLDKIGTGVHQLYDRFKDEGHWLSQFEKDAMSRGYSAPEGQRAYSIWKALTQSGPTHAQHAMERGVHLMGENMKVVGPSLHDVFADIKPAEYDDLVSWMYARHALEMWSKGKNPGISKADAQWWHDQRNSDRYEKSAKTLTDFNNAMLDMLVDAGVVAADAATKMKDAWETYIPLMRVKPGLMGRPGLGGKKLVNLPDPLRRRSATGSGLQIIDPIQATVERAIRFYERAAQQIVIDTIIDTAEKTEGMGGWIERVPPEMQRVNLTVGEVAAQLQELGIPGEALEGIDPSDSLYLWRPVYQASKSEPIARTLRGGKPALYQFDPDFYQAVSGMSFYQLPWFLEMTLGKATRALKLGATGVNFAFGQKNPIRDYMTFLAQSKLNAPGEAAKASARALPLPVPGTMITAYLSTQINHMLGKEGDPTVELWQMMGGELSNVLGLDQSRIRRSVENIVSDGTARRVWNVAKHPIDALRSIVGLTESSPRLAEFKGVLERYGYTPEKLAALWARGESPSRPVLIEAINAANDVTTNFKRLGRWGKWINRVGVLGPFFNAQVESVDKFARTWRDSPKRAFIAAAAMSAATLAYWVAVRDEDWYQEAPPWLKYGFWTLADDEGKPIVRIPRPFEWGMYVSAGAEALMNTLSGHDPAGVEQWISFVADTANPVNGPIGLTPVVEVIANRDFFRDSPIVPDRIERREPADQFTDETTEFSKFVGGELGVSPAKLEHLLSGWTGGLYRRAAMLAQGEPGEMLGSNAFAFRRDYAQSEGIFYDQLKAAEQTVNSAKLRGAPTPEQDARYATLNEYAGLMRELRNLADGVESRDEKFAYHRHVIGLAREAIGERPLARYPAPWKSDDPAIKSLAQEFLGKAAFRLTAPAPVLRGGDNVDTFKKQQEEHTRSVTRAMGLLQQTGVDYREIRVYLAREALRRGWSNTLRDSDGKLTSYGERVRRLAARWEGDED
jgi:hypothetical protein